MSIDSQTERLRDLLSIVVGNSGIAYTDSRAVVLEQMHDYGIFHCYPAGLEGQVGCETAIVPHRDPAAANFLVWEVNLLTCPYYQMEKTTLDAVAYLQAREIQCNYANWENGRLTARGVAIDIRQDQNLEATLARLAKDTIYERFVAADKELLGGPNIPPDVAKAVRNRIVELQMKSGADAPPEPKH